MRRLGLPTIVAIAVIALGAVELASGALRTGISLDEPIHVERTYGWIAHDWYVPEPYLVGDAPDPGNELASPFVYGPGYSSLAHLANVELGNEPIGNVSFSADAYAVRHLLVAALALVAVLAAGFMVWLLTGSWRFGLWAAAALLAIPVWMGHGFFNPKDVPTATGYTLVTAGLVLALAPGFPDRRRQGLIVALLAGGIFIGAGTRLALWAPFLASFVAYAGLRAGQRWRGQIRGGWKRDGAVFAGGAIGAIAIALLYPQAAETPRTLLTQSVSVSADYPNGLGTLTAGQILPAHPPWWYLGAWVGASLPLLIGALAVLGGVLALALLPRVRERGAASAWGERRLGLVLVLQQAALLPLLSIAAGATMYDGVRQHLYVFPALAVLAGVGAERVWRWARAKRRSRGWRPVVTAALSLALIAPMVEQTILFPYNYAYVNPVAGIGGVNGNWETDYWYISNREALSHVPRGTRLRCSVNLLRTSEPGATPKFDLCPKLPFEAERGDAAGVTAGEGDRRVWVISWPRRGNYPPPWCEETADVTRWLRGESVIMAYLLRCDPDRVRAGEIG